MKRFVATSLVALAVPVMRAQEPDASKPAAEPAATSAPAPAADNTTAAAAATVLATDSPPAPVPELRQQSTMQRGLKWTLVDYWATWSEPCRAAIPHLNALHREFGDRVVFIGLTDEPEPVVRRLTEPRIEYTVAIDNLAQSRKAVGATNLPHAILMDPKGIVRWEGQPASLTREALAGLLSGAAR